MIGLAVGPVLILYVVATFGAMTRRMWRLTAASALISLAFLAFTSGIPLWLVDTHGLATDAAVLGWTLAAFSIGAGLGAVLGGVLGERLGPAAVTGATLLAAAPAMISILLLPLAAPMLIVAVLAGALIYASQPLLIVAAQRAAPESPAAAAGIVMGVGTGIAGLLYVAVGALQGVVGLAPAVTVTSLLLIPAAAIAAPALSSTPPD
jgi:FSR family fosmidomycin resistance protein-like MFS transporter